MYYIHTKFENKYFNKGQGWAGLYKSRGVSGRWAIAHPDLGRLEGFSRNKLDLFIMAKIVNRLLTRM